MKEKILSICNYKENVFIILIIITSTMIGITTSKILTYDVNRTKNIPIENITTSAIGGVCLAVSDIYQEAINTPIPVNDVEDTKSQPLYDFDYESMGLSSHEIEVNRKICDIKEKYHDDVTEEISQVAMLLYECSDIKYKSASNLFNWDNELRDDDFYTPGLYYKDKMAFDCSAFVQYCIWIATVEDYSDYRDNQLLLGRGTYFQSIEGTKIDEMEKGCICLFYNGGSGVIREGEELLKHEVSTSKSNHVGIYIGNNKIIDCSESYGGIRLTDLEEKPYFADLFTVYRRLPDISNESYVTDLEQQWHTIKED